MYLPSRNIPCLMVAMQDPDTACPIIKNELDRLDGPIDDFFQVLLISAGIQLGLDEDGCYELWLASYVLHPDSVTFVSRRLRIVATAFAHFANDATTPGQDFIKKIVSVVERDRTARLPDPYEPLPGHLIGLLSPP